MRIVSSLLSLALCWAVFTSSAGAAIIFTFGAPQTFVTDSGIRSINVFANSTLAAGESTGITIGADFVLGGGAIFNGPNAGTFGGASFLGAGNIIGGITSTFNRDDSAGNLNVGNLNIVFVNSQNVFSGQTPLATLLVDTTGLAAGNYTINTTFGFTQFGGIANAASSFNVTAIPEPTSMALIGVAIGGVFGRRVLRKRKAARA